MLIVRHVFPASLGHSLKQALRLLCRKAKLQRVRELKREAELQRVMELKREAELHM